MTESDVAARAIEHDAPAANGMHSTGADTASFWAVRPGPRTTAVLLAALLAVLVPLLATVDLDVPGRPLLATAYFFLVPGVPLALALRLPSPLVTTALAVSSSLAVAILYGTATIALGWWQPVAGSWIITLWALVLSVLAVAPRRSTSSATPTPGTQPAQEVAPAPRRHRFGWLLSAALVVLTGVVWWWSTRHLDLDAAGALGLLPVTGWRFGLALLMICGLSAHALLRRRLDHVLLTGCALLVALLGYASVPVADGAGSVPVGWVHVAFAQYIADNGTVATGVDARFSWPGFFSAAAQLSNLAGVPDTRGFLVLASVVNTMAVLPGLLVVARAVTRSWRWAWVAVFVFLVTNWYQQDYFSPQATAFVIYTSVLGALLWLASGSTAVARSGPGRLRQALGRLPDLPPAVTPRTAVGVSLVLALLVAAVVLGHQLTPMTLILALGVFALTGQTRYRLLWLFASILFVGWFSYGATDYWFGHLDTVFGDLGQVGTSVGAGVSDRLVGDPVYQGAQLVRIGWSATLLAGAGLGLLVMLRRRRSDVWVVGGLAGAPFLLLALQSYGGEGVIRSFLYASPVLAALSAVALREGFARLTDRRGLTVTPLRSTWGLTLGVAALLVLGTLLLTFTRGLNVSFERTPPGQVVASETVRQLLRPGDEVSVPYSLGLTPALELKRNSLAYLDLEACDRGDLAGCLRDGRPRFVLLTLTQERNGELLENRPPGWLWQLGDELTDSGGYREIYSNAEAQLLETEGDRS